MKKNKIIAITGGTGFIGSLLAKKHIQRGDSVRILSRRFFSLDDDITYFYGDLSDPALDLRSFLVDVDIIYNCAGEVNNESLMNSVHVVGVERLVSVAHGLVGRWVQLSSVGAYGECKHGCITEESREAPSGVYEITKTKSDNIVRESGIPYTILRPSNVFGKSMNNQSIFQLINSVKSGFFFYPGGKKSLMNYVHVIDVVNALMLCGSRKESLGKHYNLSQVIEIEGMVNSFLIGLKIKRKFIKIPKSLTRAIVKISCLIPAFPLTESRLNALTGDCVYSSNKISAELRFEFNSTLKEEFKLIAKNII